MRRVLQIKRILKLIAALAILLTTVSSSCAHVICIHADGAFALEVSVNGHDCLDKHNLSDISLDKKDGCTDISMEAICINCPSQVDLRVPDCSFNESNNFNLMSSLVELPFNETKHYLSMRLFATDPQKQILKTTILRI